MRVIFIGWTQVMSHINYLESDEGNTAFVVSNISYSQFGTMCVYDEHSAWWQKIVIYYHKLLSSSVFRLVVVKIVVAEQNMLTHSLPAI